DDPAMRNFVGTPFRLGRLRAHLKFNRSGDYNHGLPRLVDIPAPGHAFSDSWRVPRFSIDLTGKPPSSQHELRRGVDPRIRIIAVEIVEHGENRAPLGGIKRFG